MWVGAKGVEKPFIYRALTAASTFGSICWDCVLLITNVVYCSAFGYSRSSNLKEMETVHEFVPFAKEILSQKPNRGLVKVFLLGSVLALFGVAAGVLETVCQPFCVQDPADEGLVQLSALERRMTELEIVSRRAEAAAALDEENEHKAKHQAANGRRNSANRLHAS
ncbi:G0/G1 switch protein 2-like [Brienomyrus brachyistius]|uniref:G0/G1 switch protein 2-like n=1 Tax=Brienomyrus brachyistius TaxID=42636 RepID=UPI0020B1C189|nr:G0/G1 switch protein 2-like [Brienomyrus brachyistius]